MKPNPTACLILLASVVHAACEDGTSPFQPPSAGERIKAIGATDELTPILKPIFAGGELFKPVAVPGPSDWLANHQEPVQTFQQYLRGRPNRPTPARRTMYLQPLGKFPPATAPDLERLKTFAESFFAMPVTISDRIPLDSLPIQQRTGSDGQRQLLSTDILGWLQERVPNDAYCLLAVTMVDLYPSENWNFVFGQADLKKRVGVYSFARYHTTVSGHQAGPAAGPLLLKRSCKVLAHETGHMFGMQHCIYFDCLMNGSNHLAEADGKPLHLCPVCLRKLHSAGQIDILDRYRKLKSFADNAGWQQESQWLKWRLKALSAESN